MSGTSVKVLQLFVALSLLIVLHEFGHFFFARLFKTRVEKFYLFFDFLFPFSGLLNFSLFKKTKGDTEYGIGWFPLGGYVKIAGMVDESMDKEQMALPPQPWEYRSKKAYQRLFIMLGGIIVNVIVAVLIYVAVFGIYGEEYLPVQNAKYGIMVDSTAKALGLHNGDKIVSVDGVPVTRFEKIVSAVVLDEGKSIQVERDGQKLDVAVKEGTIHSIITGGKGSFISARVPVVVDEVDKGTEAEKMGMKHGDSIIAVNGVPAPFYDQYDSIKRALVGQPIALTVVRNNAQVILSGKVPENKILGFRPMGDLSRYFTFEHIHYNPIQAVGKGVMYTADQFANYVRQFKMIFTSKEIKANESLGGIISFGKIFPAEFDMQKFLMLTAFVSIILAFMNLLPIPGLDGGYVIFLLWEMITGKQVSEKVMEKATTVGLVLLLTLMVYANGLDIFRLFRH
ncbi:MAG: RIP metalloprotease RseP [Chitinophagaceae bacterium]|nr:RIP metalloprotease RseP [Chitinophagaceae bacterium]